MNHRSELEPIERLPAFIAAGEHALASPEAMRITYEAMLDDAKTFADVMIEGRAHFSYMVQKTERTQSVVGRFGRSREQRVTERTDYPMWIIQVDEDYSRRPLKQQGANVDQWTEFNYHAGHGGRNRTREWPWYKHRCLAIDVNGSLLSLQKSSGNRGKPPSSPGLLAFTFSGERSLARPDDLFDTASVSNADLINITERWREDLVQAADRYTNPTPSDRETYEASLQPIYTYFTGQGR